MGCFPVIEYIGEDYNLLGKETRGLLDKKPRSEQRAQTHWINKWVPEVEFSG